jgi:hypothetical protein
MLKDWALVVTDLARSKAGRWCLSQPVDSSLIISSTDYLKHQHRDRQPKDEKKRPITHTSTTKIGTHQPHTPSLLRSLSLSHTHKWALPKRALPTHGSPTLSARMRTSHRQKSVVLPGCRSIDHPPSEHLSHTVPQPSSDFLINVFQFCDVAQVANHPNVYLAKFDDVQSMKVNKFLSTLSFCRQLWHFWANFF